MMRPMTAFSILFLVWRTSPTSASSARPSGASYFPTRSSRSAAQELTPQPDGRDGRSSRPTDQEWAALDVPQRREHAGVEMVEQMAVKGPPPGIVGVEGDH